MKFLFSYPAVLIHKHLSPFLRPLLLSKFHQGSTVMGKKALVLITQGSEEIETVTPVDVLRRAGDAGVRPSISGDNDVMRSAHILVEVSLAGLLSSDPVLCSRNVKLVPDGSLTELSSEVYDAIILPGGLKGAEAFANSEELGQLLKEQEKAGRLICAICAGPTALKAHGIGNGKKLTSYPSKKETMLEGTKYDYKEERVVVDGELITSRGPGTSLEFSLAIVEKLLGKDKAEEIGKSMIHFC